MTDQDAKNLGLESTRFRLDLGVVSSALHSVTSVFMYLAPAEQVTIDNLKSAYMSALWRLVFQTMTRKEFEELVTLAITHVLDPKLSIRVRVLVSPRAPLWLSKWLNGVHHGF